ncbi:transglycosylase domain-containing protein [Blattabacterium cuenoti]|uniref:transglycosylase domain-containing protein n=1 Tax=Blattabacterium cuenoti TaxID=1653831 RepID=UPI001EE9F023|nr:transglycosylase domain-containing protein [Blattabacterium cuenoti]
MNKKKSYIKIFIIYFLSLLLVCITIIFIVIYAGYKGFLGKLPSDKEIRSPKMEIGSKVYDCKGVLLGKFFYENRNLITYKQLPKNLVNALLAKEDIRFRKHSGIDIKSIIRAILSMGKKGGGSTISQQLAKLFFTKKSAKNKIERINQKILEWIIALELEKRYSKEEIITMYYNKFDFLYNAKGIDTAAHTYFDKKVINLNLNECAILVGMLENPSLYNPIDYPNRAKKQRNLVLFQMMKYNFLKNNQYNNESKKPIRTYFKMKDKDIEFVTYYGGFLKKEIQNLLNEYEIKKGIKLNLYTSGLKIYTSIDSRMQNYAEKSIKIHLKKLQSIFDSIQKKNKKAPFSNISYKKINRIILSSMRRTNLYNRLKKKGMAEKNIIKIFKKKILVKLFTWDGNKKVMMSPLDFIRYKKGIIQAGLLSMESSTGHIKAWVGGIDFNNFQYDHVAQTKRQVGSIFKPILYAAAIKKLHYNPCTIISNEKFKLKNWIPRNHNGKYGGFMTLKDGLALSVNTVSARIMEKVTPKTVIELAKKMGVESTIPENQSIALGSADLTLYEMTGVFNTFSNFGIYNKPSILLKIEDRNGNIIKYNYNIKRKVLNKDVAYIMLNLMQGVVKYGTAKRLTNLYNIKGDIAGKTGTTNDNSDGWFIGMIPNLTTGVWVGWENRFSHFNSLKLGQGANMALPIWAHYTNYLYHDKNFIYNEKMFFKKPKNYQWDECENKMDQKDEDQINHKKDNKEFIENKTDNPNTLEDNKDKNELKSPDKKEDKAIQSEEKPETKSTGNKPETKSTGNKSETKSTGNKPETKSTGKKPETKSTGKKPETKSTGKKPETKSTGKKPETKSTGKKPETKSTGKKPETKSTGKKPETKSTGKKPETKSTGKKPETKSTGKKPETKSTGKKPETKSTGKKPETKSTGKKPETKSKGKKPETKSKGKKPETKSTGKKPETKSTGKKPETKSTGKKPETKSTGKKPETKSKGKKPELKSTGKKPETKSKGKKPELKSTGKKPETKSKGKKTELKSTGKKPETKSKGKKTETKSTGKKPETKSTGKKPETKSKGKKPELKSTGKKPETKSKGKKPELKSTGKKPETKSKGKKPETKSTGKKTETKSKGKKPELKSTGKKPETKSTGKKTETKSKGKKPETKSKGKKP